jgi:glycosyltransferase involved in cell wall biosynthesis
MAISLAVISLCLLCFILVDFAVGNRSLKFLRDIPRLSKDFPKVSIIFAARNEARNLEEALTSILKLDYPNYEIIAINDRSKDETGSILSRAAKKHPQIRDFHIEDLPPFWLGKNHALYFGAKQATGEFILFTDADVVFDPSVLKRALNYALEQGVDHLAGFPNVVMPSLGLKLFCSGFFIFFNLYARPWKAHDPKSFYHVGVGAFNLIRKSVYESIGTHQAIAMRPDDDMKLGKLIKKHGFKQDVILGNELLTVEWYPSLKALVHGLMKNSFAGMNYNVPLVLLGVSVNMLLFLWPWFGVFLTTGTVQILNVVTLALTFLIHWDLTRFCNAKLRYFLGIPFASLLFAYILIRATALTLIQGGIYWRDTFYPLDELKRNNL